MDARSLAQTASGSGPVLAKARADRRRFRRVRIDLPGKLFVPADAAEFACHVEDLSPGGASITCDAPLVSDMPVVLYANSFGRFEGTVVRIEEGNYGVKFRSTALKRERTVEQLTLFMNRELLGEADLRRDDRTPTKGLTRFVRHDGQVVPCEVIDLSVSGISVKTDVRPAMGEFILIGQLAGRVARHHENGIGIEFIGATGPTSPGGPETFNTKLALAR